MKTAYWAPGVRPWSVYVPARGSLGLSSSARSPEIADTASSIGLARLRATTLTPVSGVVAFGAITRPAIAPVVAKNDCDG